jgi:hypothetical protein
MSAALAEVAVEVDAGKAESAPQMTPQMSPSEALAMAGNVVVPRCALGHEQGSTGSMGLERIVASGEGGAPGAAIGKAARLTFVQGLLISLNFSLGFSALQFPYMVATTGWMGYFLLLACAFVTLMTAKFLAIMMVRMPGIKTFSDIGLYAARKASGGSKRAEGAAKVSLALLQSLNLFFCLLFGVVSVQAAMVLLVPGLRKSVALAITAVTFALMVLPTLSPRALSWGGSAGVAAYFLTLFVLLGSGVQQLVGDPQLAAEHAGEMVWANEQLRKIFSMYGGILLLFAGHPVYPSVFNDLADRKDAGRVVNWTFAGVIAFSVVPSLLAIFAFGPADITAVDLPTGYLDAGTVANALGQVFLIAKMTFAAGVQMYPIIMECSRFIQAGIVARRRRRRQLDIAGHCAAADRGEHAEPSLHEDEELRPSTALHLGVGWFVVALALLTGSVMGSIELIMTLNGALFAVALCLTIPSICFVVLVPRKDEPWKVPLAWALFVLGILSCGLILSAVF